MNKRIKKKHEKKMLANFQLKHHHPIGVINDLVTTGYGNSDISFVKKLDPSKRYFFLQETTVSGAFSSIKNFSPFIAVEKATKGRRHIYYVA